MNFAIIIQGSKAEYRALNEQLVVAELLVEGLPQIQLLLFNIREHSENLLQLEVMRAEKMQVLS